MLFFCGTALRYVCVLDTNVLGEMRRDRLYSLSILICPYTCTHTESVLVCVLGQISVFNTLQSLQCMMDKINTES